MDEFYTHKNNMSPFTGWRGAEDNNDSSEPPTGLGREIGHVATITEEGDVNPDSIVCSD